MGDSTSVRDTTWKTPGKIYVRDTAAWPEVNRAWVRDSGAWKLFWTKDEPAQISNFQCKLCQDTSTSAGCSAVAGCVLTGEQHRIEWEYTGSSNGFHLCIQRSVGGGGYVEAADGVDLDNGEPDADCCEHASPMTDAYLVNEGYNKNGAGTCTTTYDYRLRVEIDGSDTLVGSNNDCSQVTGCDQICVQ